MLGYPPEQTPPPGAGTSPPPDHAPIYAVHAGRYSQRAGSTHPTGMQSCLNRAIVPGCKFTRGMYTKLTLEGKEILKCSKITIIFLWVKTSSKIANCGCHV